MKRKFILLGILVFMLTNLVLVSITKKVSAFETSNLKNVIMLASQSDNANLKSLHLNVEGLSPSFSNNITDYYIVVPENINNINVIAEPEDSNAKVIITGNSNLQEGNNKISIEVIALNNKKIYTINVTRTNNIENANTNLLNLAIENVTLEPEFEKDITQYKAEVDSTKESLNILAVPEIEGANVDIKGKENLKFGENTVTITVTAKDGKTTKEYKVLVYKKTQEEQNAEIMTHNEEREISENMNIINENEVLPEENSKKDAKTGKIMLVGASVIIVAGVGFVIARKYKN